MLFILFTKKKGGGGGGESHSIHSFFFKTVNDNSFDSFHFNIFNRATFMLDLLH